MTNTEAKKAVRRYLNALDTGSTRAWARKTEFVRQSDGSVLRRVTRSDGTVEREDIIAADRCMVTAARAHAGLSQAGFARLLGISVRTLQEWEQGRKEPSGAAKVLLKIAAQHPEILKAALPS